MSAPPRFYVRTSTGYTFRRDLTRGNPVTHHSIFDRAYCHREVGRFGRGANAWTRCESRATALVRAERRAADLNAQDIAS